MAMSKRFFKALAAKYSACRPDEGTEKRVIWDHMVTVTASAMNEESHTFQKARFLEACGYGPAEEELEQTG
jgi:hypothetical protein